MELQKLPNATTAMVLSIIALVGCCCSSGILGVILAGIALFLIHKDQQLYNLNPEGYDNYSQLKNAKIIAIIAMVISLLNLVYLIYIVASGDWELQMEQYQKLIEQFQNK